MEESKAVLFGVWYNPSTGTVIHKRRLIYRRLKVRKGVDVLSSNNTTPGVIVENAHKI